MSQYAKAIVSAVLAGYLLYQSARGLVSDAGTAVSVDEWVDVVVATIVSGAATWAVPNAGAPVMPMLTAERGPVRTQTVDLEVEQ
jgi:hypothetical protein